MRGGQLLTLRFLSILLLLCFALTAEEAIHLLRSHPNKFSYGQAAEHHTGCVPRDATGHLLLCQVPGYGSMLFLCTQKHCLPKEPATGLTITPAEEKLLEQL
jgi:hypothetical protein